MTPRELVKRRPTETLTGLGLAASIYGFLTQAGVPAATAAIVAVAIAFVPTGISEVVDDLRGPFVEPQIEINADDVDRRLKDRTAPPAPTDPGKPTKWGPGA